MKATARRTLPVLMILAGLADPALAQDYPGREQLRAQSNEFRRDLIQVTDG